MLDEIESDVPSWITRAPAPAVAADPTATTPAIALLFLFDGVGMARVGTDALLRQLGGKLAMAAFVEIQNDLAEAVETHWRQKAALTGVAPYPRIAADVWDLLMGVANLLCSTLLSNSL